MRTLILILTLALPLHVVFVQPPGEEFTTEEQQQALVSVRAAVAWWHDLAPIPIALGPVVTSTLVLTTTDPFVSESWQPEPERGAITIYILDNSSSGRMLFGRLAGVAQPAEARATMVLSGLPGPNGLAETATHELGHVVYKLGDLPWATLDIMGNAPAAYQRRAVGCTSLAALGKPCMRVYLPVVHA